VTVTVLALAGGSVTVVGTQYGGEVEVVLVIEVLLEVLEVVVAVVVVELVAIQLQAEEYLDTG
jgi:hypothetical protein